MYNSVFRVVSCGTPQSYTSNAGKEGWRLQIVLQDLGSYQRDEQSQPQSSQSAQTSQTRRIGNAYVCTVFGYQAQNLLLFSNDLVIASLRFEARQTDDGRWFQDITLGDIVKVK